MGVFNGKVATPLIVPDPLTDKGLPSPASLVWRLITTPACLASTQGQHCELIHGDDWSETAGDFTDLVEGDVTTTVADNQTHVVGRDQKITVMGNHKETLASHCCQSVLGPHLILNGTVRNETRLGAYNEVYGKTEWHDDQSGDLVTAVDHSERYNSATLTHGLDLQSFGMAFSLGGIVAGLYGGSVALKTFLDYTFTGVHAEVTLLHMEAHLRHTEDHDGPSGLPAPG